MVFLIPWEKESMDIYAVMQVCVYVCVCVCVGVCVCV